MFCETPLTLKHNMKKIDLSSVVIEEILSIFPIKLSAGEEKGMANRNGTGFIFAEKGQLTYRMNGQVIVSDQNHALLQIGRAHV